MQPPWMLPIEAVAEFGGVGIAIEPMDATVGGFLVFVANDGTEDPSVWRVGATLTQVIACFGEVPEVVDDAGRDKG